MTSEICIKTEAMLLIKDTAQLQTMPNHQNGSIPQMFVRQLADDSW